jgi:outer membrane lipoprotein-sorting protein
LNKSPFLILLACLCAAGSPVLAAAPAAPDPTSLLDAALQPPGVSYEGRIMVTHWYGKQTRAEEMNIYYSPPDRYRREFLAPDGGVARVMISDGEREEVHLLKQKKVLGGDAVRSSEKQMPEAKERELLLKNYRASVLRSDKVAGRPAWVLELKPVAQGKPWQRLWLDQETSVVLENKRFLPKRSFVELSRFDRFEPRPKLDDALFQLQLGTAAIPGQGLEPDFLSLDELKKATGKSADFPTELPGGFLFESADYFTVGKETILHARYTDGLAVLSLFETDKPVRLPKTGLGRMAGPDKGAGALRLSSAGKVLMWKGGRRHYTLMGDVSRDLLEAISARLK